MKKLLVFSGMMAAMTFGTFSVPSVEAKTETAAETQMRYGQPRWGRVVRTVTRTRITYVGRYRYRETVRTFFYRNGRTRTQVINRVRLGRRW